MMVEFDRKNQETILHLSVNEMGDLLFGLSMGKLAVSNPTMRIRLEQLRDEIRKGMEQ